MSYRLRRSLGMKCLAERLDSFGRRTYKRKQKRKIKKIKLFFKTSVVLVITNYLEIFSGIAE